MRWREIASPIHLSYWKWCDDDSTFVIYVTSDNDCIFDIKCEALGVSTSLDTRDVDVAKRVALEACRDAALAVANRIRIALGDAK